MSSKPQAGLREVWTATHGRAGRYHIALNGEATAACSPCETLRDGHRRIILGDLSDADEIPEYMRCQRPACKKRWPSAKTTSPP